MSEKRAWLAYPQNYYASQVNSIASWIKAGESGSVVGLTGSGKSNLLGFLCNRPEALQLHLPGRTHRLALVQVDLNDLPDSDLATFYRLILRSLFEAQAQFTTLGSSLPAALETLYRKIEDNADAFFAQSTLREALFLLEQEQVRLVLVMDPFDTFCQTAPLELLDNLRGLRDSFKATLSYIVGVRSQLAYLRDPLEIGRIYDLLDTHVCWVGAMAKSDARWVLDQVAETTGHEFAEDEIEQLVQLTGGYPLLLRAAGLWRVRSSPGPEIGAWAEALAADRSVHHRLERIWNDLTQEERQVLSELQKWQDRISAREAARESGDGRAKQSDQEALESVLQRLAAPYQSVLTQLTAKGVCTQTETGWRIASPLMAIFVARVEGRDTGKIWLDEATETLYLGQKALDDLAPLERSVLMFLVNNPQVRHAKTDLIVNTWPDDLRRQGVTDQSLYQVILELRKKIEPDWTKPRHLITWRGKPEGGYQFFPEGRPG